MTHRDQFNASELADQAQRRFGDAARDGFRFGDAASESLDGVLELLCEHGFEGMANAMRILLNEAMKLERSLVLGARPYERTAARRGHANGFKPKTVHTRVGDLELAIPQTRGVEFYPSSLERGARSERALKLAIAEMYIQGVSTRKVAEVMKELCGLDVTSSQVSRAVQALDEELAKWRERPLGEFKYLMFDARYEKARVGGAVAPCSLLAAVGVDADSRRSVLGVSVSPSEAEVHWRDFLAGLQARGLHGVRLIVSDDHAGLRQALAARFTGVPWQRCQFHLAKNLLDHLPPNVSQAEASADLRGVFNAPNRAEAERLLNQMVAQHAKSAPKLAAWLERNVPEGFAVFDLPAEHRRRLRTNNGLERLNREIKRRTRVVSIFPNEAALLRLASAVLMEIDEEWQTGKRYL